MKETKQIHEFTGLMPQLIQIFVGGVVVKEFDPIFADEIDLTISIVERKIDTNIKAESTI